MRNKNSNLHKAKKEKNDEFYTRYEDIAKELQHYKEHFIDKIVYCNCDTADSNFVKYFQDNKETLRIKELIFSGGLDGLDFRSNESIDLLKKSDVVVSNPPFSLFIDYVAQLVEYEKDFLIIGALSGIGYRDIFPLIKDNKIKLGVNSNKSMSFESPYENVNGTDELIKLVNIAWYTTLDSNVSNEELVLDKTYNEIDYPKYDNYDAINVNKTANIPKDYNGCMGVPISFMTKYNPEQFEIVKFRKGDDDKDLAVNGKTPFIRIIIKAKSK